MRRVALGPTDPAGTAGALAVGLHAHGVAAETVTWSPHPLGFAADRVLGRAGRVWFGLGLPFRYDIVQIEYARSWLPREPDLRWARTLGRTVVARFHGDDCRLYGIARALFPSRGRTGDPTRDPDVEARVRRIARVAHAAVVADLELATYVLPHFERVYVVPLPLHSTAEPRPKRRRRRPVVVHAPSDPRFKGTERIREAVTGLPVEFRLVTGVPHSVVATELACADIAIDQIDSVTAGVFALEAMRAGLPVLCELDPTALPRYQASMPIVPVTGDSLRGELEALLADEDQCRRLGDAGRAYVAATHEPEAVAARVLRVYEHARSGERGLFEVTAQRVWRLDREAAEIVGRLRVLSR